MEYYLTGNRVGIVDCDEQCTLSTLVLKRNMEGTNVISAYDRAVQSVADGLEIQPAKMLTPDCVRDKISGDDNEEPTILILPGSSEFQMYDRKMSRLLMSAAVGRSTEKD